MSNAATALKMFCLPLCYDAATALEPSCVFHLYAIKPDSKPFYEFKHYRTTVVSSTSINSPHIFSFTMNTIINI